MEGELMLNLKPGATLANGAPLPQGEAMWHAGIWS